MGCGNSKAIIPSRRIDNKPTKTRTIVIIEGQVAISSLKEEIIIPDISRKNKFKNLKRKTKTEQNSNHKDPSRFEQTPPSKINRSIHLPSQFSEIAEKDFSSCESPLSSKRPRSWNSDDGYQNSESDEKSSDQDSNEDTKDYLKHMLVCEENLTKKDRIIEKRSSGIKLKSPKKRGSVNLAYRGNNHANLQKWANEKKKAFYANGNKTSIVLTRTTGDTFSSQGLSQRNTLGFGKSLLVKRSLAYSAKKLPSLPTLAPHNSRVPDPNAFEKKKQVLARKHSDIESLPSGMKVKFRSENDAKAPSWKVKEKAKTVIRCNKSVVSINGDISNNFNSIETFNYFKKMKRSLSSFRRDSKE